MPQQVFMGVGYNPLLRERGERLDMLEYVAWMKGLLDSGVSFVSFWDASVYQLVNVLPKKKFTPLPAYYDSGAAASFLETLADELERPKRQALAENCEQRNAYLWKLRSLLGLSLRTGSVYSAKDLLESSSSSEDVAAAARIRNRARFADLLSQASLYVDRLRADKPELLAKIFCSNANPAAQMYLPLEIAEALYLQNNTPGCISGKFGPKNEEFFDQCILGMQQERFQPYATLLSSSSPVRPGYLADTEVLWTCSPNDYVVDVVRGKTGRPDYTAFVRSYLSALRDDGENLEDCALRLRDALRIEEVK